MFAGLLRQEQSALFLIPHNYSNLHFLSAVIDCIASNNMPTKFYNFTFIPHQGLSQPDEKNKIDNITKIHTVCCILHVAPTAI